MWSNKFKSTFKSTFKSMFKSKSRAPAPNAQYQYSWQPGQPPPYTLIVRG